MDATAMATSTELADWVSNYFAANQQRVAEVLAGPKRETWFSSESFVALSHAASPLPDNTLLPSFSCWGEQEYTTIFRNIEAQVGPGGQPRRRPDVVCYLPENGPQAIDAILELKLVLNDENPDAGLTDLKTQLVNAREFAPNARVLGLIFLAAAPQKTPGTFDTAARTLRRRIEDVMPENEGFGWVIGHDVSHVFRSVMTRFHYPSMAVSLALGVRELV